MWETFRVPVLCAYKDSTYDGHWKIQQPCLPTLEIPGIRVVQPCHPSTDVHAM